MTTCDETGAEQTPVDAGLGVDPGPGELTTDVLDLDDTLDDGAIYSLRRDVDTHGALVRGLAQYMWSLRVEALGRVLKLGRVTEHAADVHDEAVDAPYAAVYADADEGRYGDVPRTPTQIVHRGKPIQFSEADKVVAGLYQTAAYVHDRITLAIWCDTEPERAQVIKAVEDMLAPHLASNGLYLRVRHYHGAIARYNLLGQARESASGEIAAGSWIVRFRVAATLPVIRVHRRPTADVRIATSTGLAR